MNVCRSCKAPIVWAKTVELRSIPLDATADGSLVVFGDGNLADTGRRAPGGAKTTMVVRYVDAGEGRYRSHFASCPDSSNWRKR